MNTKNVPKNNVQTETGFDVTIENDYELIELMTWQESEPELAHTAFGEFYKRHYNFIFSAAYIKLLDTPALSYASDIATETFIRVYEKGAITFKNFDIDDLNDIRGHVRVWLCAIVKNLIKDLFQGKAFEEIDLPYDEIERISKGDPEPVSENVLKLRRIIDSELNDREKHVLIIHSDYYDPENPNRQIPSEILDEICSHWNITKANFRQIKSRAIKKIKQQWERLG